MSDRIPPPHMYVISNVFARLTKSDTGDYVCSTGLIYHLYVVGEHKLKMCATHHLGITQARPAFGLSIVVNYNIYFCVYFFPSSFFIHPPPPFLSFLLSPSPLYIYIQYHNQKLYFTLSWKYVVGSSLNHKYASIHQRHTISPSLGGGGGGG